MTKKQIEVFLKLIDAKIELAIATHDSQTSGEYYSTNVERKVVEQLEQQFNKFSKKKGRKKKK